MSKRVLIVILCVLATFDVLVGFTLITRGPALQSDKTRTEIEALQARVAALEQAGK